MGLNLQKSFVEKKAAGYEVTLSFNDNGSGVSEVQKAIAVIHTNSKQREADKEWGARLYEVSATKTTIKFSGGKKAVDLLSNHLMIAKVVTKDEHDAVFSKINNLTNASASSVGAGTSQASGIN